jgi:NTP pyrophosphatase (non-canonical NTP hydrolase)
MNFTDYQREARKTAVYPDEHKITYPALGLSGEAGEVANKVKKILRDDGGRLRPEVKDALSQELGDCLWYLALVAWDLELDLQNIAEENLKKLADRQARGTLQGEGDKR